MKNQTANTQRNVIMAIAFIVFTMTNSFSNPIEAIANNINSVNYNNHYSQLSTSMNRDTVTTKGICYYKVTQTNFRGGATVTIKGSNVELRSVKIYDTSGAATAAKIVFEAQWGTADNSDFTYYVSEAGIKCDTGMYAVLSAIDFLVVIYS